MNVPLVVFLISALPFPLCYVLNTQPWMQEPRVILATGVIILTLIIVLPSVLVSRMKRPDFILRVMGMFMFSSMIDLIIALEADGILSEFMTFYLKEGEPYLWTPYGTMINYWDGMVHYGLGLWMLYCIARGKSYRRVGLYWVGSITNSLLVLVPGSIIGKFGVRWAILLNLPYLVVPVWIGFRLLQARPSAGNQIQKPTSILKRPVDLLCILYFAFAASMDLLRGFIALGATHPDLLPEYLEDHEPHIMDPVGYPKIQMIVNLVYFLPFYVSATYGLLFPGQAWMEDWSLIYAGMAAQGQFSHIGGAVHSRTPAEYQVPPSSHSQNVFWAVNILLFVGPQIFALKQNARKIKQQKLM